MISYVGNLQLSLAYLFARQLCFARLSHGLGVRLSARVSVTPLSPIKTVKARLTKSSLWAASTTLVFSDKMLCPWVKGFPSNESVKEGYPTNSRYFAVIGSYSVKIVVDRSCTNLLHIITSTGDELFRFINIDDLERP